MVLFHGMIQSNIFQLIRVHGYYYRGDENLQIISSLSYTGNRIDSGSYFLNHYEQNLYPHDHEYVSRNTVMEYRMLPLVKKNNDSIIFSFEGSALKNLVSNYKD